MIALLIASFVVLAAASVPVAIAMGVAVASAVVLLSPFPLVGIVQRMVTGVDSFVLLAVPFFVLTGRLMNQGGITDRLFELARTLVGPVRGGLAHANVLASMIFAGMSGSAVADAGGLGIVEVKAMTDRGYRKEFAAAVTVASSTIGPIIPPSIPLVIYGAMAEVPVGRLLLGGLLPGLFMGLALMAAIFLLSFRERLPRDPASSLQAVGKAVRRAFLPLLTPVILIGGIISKVFTPTEAAAFAAVYAFLLSYFIYRTVRLRDIPAIVVDTLVTTAVVTFIISATSGFSWLLIVGKHGQRLVESVAGYTQSPWLILLGINVALFLLGCVMEAGVLLVLLTPLLVPVVRAAGVDPVHFGVVMVLNLMIGGATPPVGMSLFVVSEACGIKLERLMREVLPQIIPLILVLLLVTYVPWLVLAVPQWLLPVR